MRKPIVFEIFTFVCMAALTWLMVFLLARPTHGGAIPLTCDNLTVQKAILHLRLAVFSSRIENGIVIDFDGQTYSQRYFFGNSNSIPLQIHANSVLMLHSHPPPFSARPSDADIENSKRTKLPGIIVSQSNYWIIYSDGSNEQLNPNQCVLH